MRTKLPAPADAYSDPSNVEAIDGEVVMMGPDGVGVSMTPEAAEETAERLKVGALQAKGQKADRKADRQPEDGSDGDAL